MKQTLLAATLLSAAFAFPALAGDPTPVSEEPSPTVAPASLDWSGLHFGLGVAKPSGDNAWEANGGANSSFPGDWSGSLPTLSAGYDWQRGSLVYGVALTMSTGEMTAVPTSDFGLGSFGCTGCLMTVDKLTTVSARLGWSLGKTLVFARIGATRADALATYDSGAGTSGEGSVNGQTVGIGIERFVGSKITISAEYSQTDLGTLDLPNCFGNCFTNIEFDMMQLGLNYRW